MTDPNEVADCIDDGGISDYDGCLQVNFNGKEYPKYNYSIDNDVIIFPFAIYKLTEWLRGLSGDVLWSVEWFNK